MPIQKLPAPYERIVRERERRAITGVSTSGWYRLMSAGTAPRPVPTGEHAVGWLLSDLLDWIERRRRERDTRGDSWTTLGDAAAQVVAKIERQRKRK